MGRIINPFVWNQKPPFGTSIERSSLVTGLSALWGFDEGEGLILHDLTGNGSDAVITGASWQATQFGLGLNFVTGQIARVTSTSTLSLMPPVSVFAMIAPASINTNGNRIIGSRNDNNSGGFEGDFWITNGQVLWQWYDGTTYYNYYGTKTVPTGVMSAIGWSISPNQASFYLNGAITSTQTILTPNPYSNPIEIGNYGANLTQFYLNGPMMILGVWNRVLTNAEHASLATNPWQIFKPQIPFSRFGISKSIISNYKNGRITIGNFPFTFGPIPLIRR